MNKLKQRMGLRGIHRVTLARITGPEAQAMHDEVVRLQQAGDAAWQPKLKEFNRRFGIMTKVIENVTCTAGRTVIAKALGGYLTTLDETEVNYVALGTSASVPAVGDTQLGTELYRKAISSTSYADNFFYGTAFYAAGQGTGTLKEHGLFINGTASANSGSLLSHMSLGTVVKGALDTLTVETEIQINDA